MIFQTTYKEEIAAYPRDIAANIEWRKKVFERAGASAEIQAEFKSLCARDIQFFFNSCLWTRDPRAESPDIPFITYPYQDQYLDWLRSIGSKPEDGLTEKSRDMGVSWLVLGYLLHRWLFEDSFSALIGSYIEDLIDSTSNMDTHFERLRYLIKSLPGFLKPKQSQGYMRLNNEENGSSIIGYAPTAKFSRQGRYSLVWADEFAFWQWGRGAWTAMGDATKCRLVTSTVNGKGNKFAELALKTKINKATLHWTLHPKKDQAWYEEEKLRRTEDDIAQELDINYNKSVKGRVYPEFAERNYLAKQEYDPLQPLFIAWDFGFSDPTAIIWFQLNKYDNTVRVIDCYQNSNKAVDFYVPFITGEVKSGQVYTYTDEEYFMIQRHKGWQEATHYGDPTGSNRDRATGSSFIADLRKAGIYVNVNTKEFDLKTRIGKTKMLIRRLAIDKDLSEFIDALENARYPERSENSQATSPIDKPIHDWTSHYRTALEYYAVNENIKGKKEATVIDPRIDKIEVSKKYFDKLKSKKSLRTPNYRRAC